MDNERGVWVVQDRAGMNFDAAKEYGALKFLFDEDVNPFDVRAIYAHARVRFETEARSDDWFLPSGSIQVNLAAALAFTQQWNRLNLLIFHAGKRIYVPRELDLD